MSSPNRLDLLFEATEKYMIQQGTIDDAINHVLVIAGYDLKAMKYTDAECEEVARLLDFNHGLPDSNQTHYYSIPSKARTHGPKRDRS